MALSDEKINRINKLISDETFSRPRVDEIDQIHKLYWQ